MFCWDKLGIEPLCNHRKERGIFIGDFCLPFCARCTGIYMGTLLYLIYVVVGGSKISFAVALMLMYPTLIDGVLQYIYGIESTNARRLTTGILAGIGCGAVDLIILGGGLCRF